MDTNMGSSLIDDKVVRIADMLGALGIPADREEILFTGLQLLEWGIKEMKTGQGIGVVGPSEGIDFPLLAYIRKIRAPT